MAFTIKGLVSDGTLPTTAKQNLAADIGNTNSPVRQALDAAGLGKGAGDAEVAALVANEATATGSALATAYAKKDRNLIDTLPTPFYIAHRGGAKAAPEHTLEAFRGASSTGIEVLETDVVATGDGALVCFHDYTVDRTTDGTGQVSSYSLPAFLSLNAAADVPWPREAPSMTLEDFMASFGKHKVIQVEPKSAVHTGQIINLAESLGVAHNLMIETQSLAVAQEAVGRGVAVWFYWGTTITSPSVADVVAAGVQHLGAARPISDADTATLVATGLPVTIYNIDRRVDRDHYRSLGVKGISTDNPTYVKANWSLQRNDSWRYGVWGHGLNSTRNMPPIQDGALVLNQQGNLEYVTVGEVSPIGAAAGTYTIDLDLGWQTLPADLGKALQVHFALPNDKYVHYNGSFTTCYQVHFRANGSLELYKMTTSGAGSPITTVSTPAMVAGAFAHLKINVTPTGFTITRTDTASTPITSTDTSYRGGYLDIGRYSNDGVALFRNLTIS